MRTIFKKLFRKRKAQKSQLFAFNSAKMKGSKPMENTQVEVTTTENEVKDTTTKTTETVEVEAEEEIDSKDAKKEEEETLDEESNENEEDGDGAEFTDEEQDEETKKELEKRSKYAQKRREKEEREKEIEKIKQDAYRQALIDSVDGVNPFTGEKIEDQHDVDEYLTMREMDKKGLDPIADYHKYLKDKAREERNKTNFNAQKLTQEQLIEDAKLFQTTYPKVKISDLQSDSRFLKFSDGKLETQPLTKVYGDYLEFVKEFDAEVDKRARRLAAKAKSSPGAQDTSATTAESEYFTLEQIRKMSQKEVSQNFEKVEKSLAYHNKNK